jgi:hypothetical protein
VEKISKVNEKMLLEKSSEIVQSKKGMKMMMTLIYLKIIRGMTMKKKLLF